MGTGQEVAITGRIDVHSVPDVRLLLHEIIDTGCGDVHMRLGAAEIGDAGMLVYRTDGGTMFSVYQTEYAGQAGHTIAQFHVDDVVAEARALQAKGVALETYDLPGVEWDDGIADMGGMGKAAWFKDSEGNILCIDSGFPED